MHLSRLNEPIMRIVAVLANFAWIAVGVLALFTNDMNLAISAWPAGVIGVTAMVLLMTGHTDLRPLLIIGVAALAIGTATLPPDGYHIPMVMALSTLGIILSLYIERGVFAYLVTYSVGLMVVVIIIEPDVTNASITAITSAIAFAFMAYIVRWLVDQTSHESQRYRSLFHNSPVALLEEDFTAVGLLLKEIRERGVTDLEDYLEEHPDAALRIAGLIEIKAANEAAVRLLEADSSEELLGQLKNRDSDTLESIKRQLMAVWNAEDHIVTDLPNAKTLRGSRRHLSLSWAAPLVDGTPDLAHVSVAAVDVTESREARIALEGLLRSKDELVATVSHELRTPLTTVVGLADELADSIESFDATELREFVALIASEGREVSTIVEDLLVAAQAEAGHLRLNREQVDLVVLANEVHNTLPNRANVPLFAPDKPVWVAADPVRIRQILRNLVVNADRYGGEDVRICVAVNASGAALEVRDTGGPLPFKEREAIFDRYYRARQVPGLTASVGLGLTVSRQLARSMDGDLTYAHDGHEAIFELSLPLFISRPVALDTQREAAG